MWDLIVSVPIIAYLFTLVIYLSCIGQSINLHLEYQCTVYQ